MQSITYSPCTEDSDSDSEWPRKRQRLSSPTYDEQFELSQDDVKAFDMFEQKLSQALSSPLKPSQKLFSQARPQRGFEVASALNRSKGTADHASLPTSGESRIKPQPIQFIDVNPHHHFNQASNQLLAYMAQSRPRSHPRLQGFLRLLI